MWGSSLVTIEPPLKGPYLFYKAIPLDSYLIPDFASMESHSHRVKDTHAVTRLTDPKLRVDSRKA